MPVVATPTTPIVLTIDQVRRFMRDRPDTNILLDTVEFSQEDINQGVELIISRYNSLTPVSGITVAAWPEAQKYVLLVGITAYLLKSMAIQQLRNQATYQDGDIAPIGIDDKSQAYLGLAQTFDAEWLNLATRIKAQRNLESAYGSLHSGYNSNAYRYR